MVLFGDPARLCLGHPLIGIKASNVLAIISEGSTASGVGKFACRSEMLGPSLGAGGKRLIPYKGWNSNCTTLAVMYS